MEYEEKLLKSIKSESYVSPKVEKTHRGERGYGLVARESIKKDEIVSISGGIILTEEQYELLVKDSNYGDYSYFIENGFLICPLNPSEPSDDWRMNHCCEPNCGVRGQIVFVAIKDISVGEELTFDYAMTETNPDYSIDLDCKKESCRKKFTGNDWKEPSIQKKYDGYMSLYIQNKIKNNEK